MGDMSEDSKHVSEIVQKPKQNWTDVSQSDLPSLTSDVPKAEPGKDAVTLFMIVHHDEDPLTISFGLYSHTLR